jgi:outer membrane protein assembly factor BamA
VFYLPKVTYSDSRGLGFGGNAVFPFRWPGTSVEIPASELKFKGRVTVKGQTQADLEAEIHPVDRHGLKLRVAHETLVERYYGVGPDTPDDAEEAYRPSDLRVYAELFRDLWADLRLGARFEVERVDLLETKDGGALAQEDIRGTRGGEYAVGTGLVLDWDRRDSRYFPHRGFYLQAFGLFFDEEIGSDFDFNNYNLDFRAYLPMAESQLVALQFFTYAAKGQPPFWHFAELGGRAHSRGYRRGRYRDRVLLSAQAEYRARLFWRLGVAGFVGVADVAAAADRMQLEYMKSNFGGGPRFFVGDQGREMTIRLDVGFGGDVPRYYFSLGEAF